MREMWAWSLHQEDPLEKEMEMHSSILAWEIPWTERSLASYSPYSNSVRHNLVTKQQHKRYHMMFFFQYLTYFTQYETSMSICVAENSII